MKINFYISIIMLLLLIVFAHETSGKTDSKGSSNLKKDKPAKNPGHLEKNDPKLLWPKLFGIPRSTACLQTQLFENLVNNVLHSYTAVGDQRRKFAWVKEWGFGPVSYFFDYIDDVLRDDIVKEFKKIVKNVGKFSKEDKTDYSDPLNLNKQMAHADPRARLKFAKMLKEYNVKIKSSYFSKAINAVQLHHALPLLGWRIYNPLDDYAKEFVLQYDMDGDGRLNARELVLGAIMNNKTVFNYKTCKYCFKKALAKIDSMFKFFNCADTGFIDAEQIWAGFPQLKRKTNKYNIFGIKNSLSIRTNAINDFVLKNQGVKDAFLNMAEFRQGVLLGFWDRQTTQSGVIDGDSRNLRQLRWSHDGQRDTFAYNYMKETIILELKQKAEERKAAMVNFKKQKVTHTTTKTTVTN